MLLLVFGEAFNSIAEDIPVIETFSAHRSLLFGIAYRMLGRVAEAEDIVQEAWLRWQKQDASQILTPQAWLVSTTTRLCIDRLRSAQHEREKYYGVWLPEPLMPVTEINGGTVAELSGSLTMAFMMMLDSLGPTERAVFLLREVFDYDYDVIAGIVGKTEANCRQIVRRAKTELQTTAKPPTPPTEQARRLVEQFLIATSTGEMKGMLELLAEESTVYSDGGGRVKAAGRPILGANHVCRFLLGIWPRFVTEMERRFVDINGSPGLLMSLNGQVHYAFSFEIADGRVRNIYIFCNPEKLRHLAVNPSH